MSESKFTVDAIPEPEVIKRMISESVRKTILLRGVLRVAKRKATIDRQRTQEDAQAAAESQVSRG